SAGSVQRQSAAGETDNCGAGGGWVAVANDNRRRARAQGGRVADDQNAIVEGRRSREIVEGVVQTNDTAAVQSEAAVAGQYAVDRRPMPQLDVPIARGHRQCAAAEGVAVAEGQAAGQAAR